MDLPTVVCANCGTPNEPGRKFCSECGHRLGVTCAVCGTVNPAVAKFCGECGSALGADAAAPAGAGVAGGALPTGGPEPVAERRLVSVLFADLVGFTSASEGRDPEETRDLLTRYFDVGRSVIERHGGTVEKFIGDAVMAVWGAPVAHEDDAERAVRAGLELVAAVPALADGEHPLQARAGVLTGEAAVTVGASGQGMVAGDLVNTASRLQSVAAPGTVLVGEATYHAASTAIAFEPAGEQALKGKASPVPAWRAVAVVARRGGEGRVAILEPPFVGRDDELRQLKDLFDATIRERKSRMVLVVGQAGIGKTRLAWELEKYLDGVVDLAYWHEGRSPAYGEGISYWALAEMVRRRAGIVEGDDAATVRRRLGATLDEFVLDPVERKWIEPRLAGLLGLAELPTEGREELFAAWRTYFERIAGVAPVIMVFGDLHWADQGLLDFIEDLLRWARSAPIFVVALARPELLERRSDFGAAVRTLTRINLEPLPDDAMTELLDGLLPGLPGPALASLVDRAEGIPLYAVETARMLIDRGLLTHADGTYRLTGDLPRLGVAETLQALIAARLDANQPEDRALLLDASVLGRSFTVEALAAVAGREPADIGDNLERLVRRELLTVQSDPRSPEHGQYQFVQDLVREVAYQNLAKPDRRTRHLAAARHVESLGSEELAGVLASHYVSAHQASRPGPEADALATQARIALQAAADRAASLHSHRQALAYLEQALGITQDPGEQAALHLRATQSGESAGDIEPAIRHAEDARALYQQLGDPRGALRAATWLGRHQTTAKLEETSVQTFERAIADAEAIRDAPEYAEALAELSRVYMLTWRPEEAVATADRALKLAGQHGLDRAVIEAMINKGTALENMGRGVEAEGILRGAIVLADRSGLPMASARARNNLLGILIDDIPGSIAINREGLELGKRVGNRSFRNQFLFNLAELAIRTGNLDDPIFDEIAAVEESEVQHAFYRGGFASARARRHALRGQADEAEQQIRVAGAAASELESPLVNAAMALHHSQLHLPKGEWQAAIEAARRGAVDPNFVLDSVMVWGHAAVAADLQEEIAAALAAHRASPFPGRSTSAAIRALEGGLAAREGRWDDARGAYQFALAEWQEIGLAPEVALIGLEWGLLAADHDPEAARALAAAESYFASLGAQRLVERIRNAFVPSGKGKASAATHDRRAAARPAASRQ